MKIVFYSTNACHFDTNTFLETTIPSKKSEWEALAKDFPEHEFFVATQLPGRFLIDTAEGVFENSPKNVKYVCLIKNSAEEISQEILELQPDLAIAASFWVTPYDWLSIKDSMIAQLLAIQGIKTVANSVELTSKSFDKWQTHVLLENSEFFIPKAVYVHHELFWCERGRKEIKSNVYKELVLSQLENLKYPVIIKDTVGLSSYGAEVVPTFKAAQGYLLSHKNSSDRIVEEYVEGLQFGAEIHGTPGNYTILPPFLFSVNQYGITSPKQSVKLGPIENQKYCTNDLQKMLLNLAEKLKFSGIVQVDLVFSESEKKWYILELNPRLSGMSELYAAAQNVSLCKMLLKIALGENSKNTLKLEKICNIKLKLLSDEQLKEVSKLPFVKQVHQIHNLAAKQKRETGYCEIILFGEDFFQIQKNLKILAEKFPDFVENDFLEKASELLEFV